VQEGKGKERMRAEGMNTREEEGQDGGNKGQEKREKRKRCGGSSQPRKGNRGGRRRDRSQTGDRGDEGGRPRRGRMRRVGEGIVVCNGHKGQVGGRWSSFVKGSGMLLVKAPCNPQGATINYLSIYLINLCN